MKIRKEKELDYREVENVIREAFWNKYRPGCFEHYVVHKLRKEKEFIKELDYVLEDNGKIIGSIVYSNGLLKTNNGEINAVTFGPVAILPEYQKKGLGEKLIRYTLKLAEEMEIPFVVKTGDPDYYKKYGFVSASKYKIFYEGGR